MNAARILLICAAAWMMLLPRAHAADRAVIVMGLDTPEQHASTHIGIVARDTRLFNQVLETIAGELRRQGFNVFDERALTLDKVQERKGRTEAELIEIARTVQHPPLDAAVIFSVYAGARKLSYTTDVYARVTGRILNVRTGEKIGSFDAASPGGWKATRDCDGDCLLEALTKSIKPMAVDVGSTLGRQLAAASPTVKKGDEARYPPRGYTLVFTGFSTDDISGVEEYLVAFKGYKAHKPATTAPRRVSYWYETDTDAIGLNHNLRMMLDRIGAEGSITFSRTDNTFTVEKLTPAP